jgi:CRISPR-associated protein Cas6
MPAQENKVDLAFHLIGRSPLPSDHGFSLFGAISRILPQAHEANEIGILPITGNQIGGRRMQLHAGSRLVLRVYASEIATWLPLAGKKLDIEGSQITVGVPEVRTLLPSTALRSRLVTTKNGQDQRRFEAEMLRQLGMLGVNAEASLTIGKRRTICIHRKEVVGYEVVIEGLSFDESLAIQTQGVGGRRHMGCGVFLAHQSKVGGQ